jgi:putative tryptophan/tyrosine transport system substrate-binding protein
VIKRRLVLAWWLLAAACLAPPAWAQQPARLPLVGILSPGRQAGLVCPPGTQGGGTGCLLEGMRALGYVDGRNVTYVVRFADGAIDRLAPLAAELVALRPDVIYTYTTGGADAAAKATSSIPIVVGSAAERTMERLAGEFARPVGNVTGLTLTIDGHEEKCLQLLKELAPRTSRVAYLANPDNPIYASNLARMFAPAKQLGITLTRIDARGADELAQAFAAIRASRSDAVFIPNDQALTGTTDVRQQIIQWALGQRLPVASSNGRVAADGGLVSLGTDGAAQGRRAAVYVQRILGGAKPGELPVERPTRYKLTLNRKTAAALGITIAPSMLMRADEVIQ